MPPLCEELSFVPSKYGKKHVYGVVCRSRTILFTIILISNNQNDKGGGRDLKTVPSNCLLLYSMFLAEHQANCSIAGEPRYRTYPPYSLRRSIATLPKTHFKDIADIGFAGIKYYPLSENVTSESACESIQGSGTRGFRALSFTSRRVLPPKARRCMGPPRSGKAVWTFKP
jgi:hypothetical protein